ncbi:MAG: hypothetical protein AAGH88_11215 [Planctomycetota bacterium]
MPPDVKLNQGGMFSDNGLSDPIPHEGNVVRLLLQGDFGGGTATLLYCDTEGGTYGSAIDMKDGSSLVIANGITDAAYVGKADLPSGYLKIQLAEAVSPSLRWRATHDLSVFRP